MKVACIGAGYTGAPAMVNLASKCPDINVVVCDASTERINAWNSDQLPMYEPGLLELVQSCRHRNLHFSTEMMKHVSEADIIFVSVNTPTKTKGIGAGKAANLFFWEAAARLIATACTHGNKIIVEKSTVPVKTSQAISKVLSANGSPKAQFEILSNPEFMSQGTAMHDLQNPDRVLLGGRNTSQGLEALGVLRSLYERWVPSERIITSDLWSAELSKLTANAFLAQRISSINAISALCEETGADVQQVAYAIGEDSRIGRKFLQASVGFGGSCFQKDILNLVYICDTLGLHQVAAYWLKVVQINDFQKQRFVQRIIMSMFGTIRNKKIALLGFSYKKDTADTRDTPALDIARGLMQDGAQLTIYDPKVTPEQIHYDMSMPASSWEHPHYNSPRTSTALLKTVDVAHSPYEACQDAHAVCIITDWDEFRNLDYGRIYASMNKPAFVFDGRNTTDPQALRNIGFIAYGLGRPLDSFVQHEGTHYYGH